MSYLAIAGLRLGPHRGLFHLGRHPILLLVAVVVLVAIAYAARQR